MIYRYTYITCLTTLILTILMLSPAMASSGDILTAEGKRSAPLYTLPQWQRIIEDFAFEQGIPSSGKTKAWKEFIASVKNETPLRQILKVNLWFNGFPYKQDNWIYGQDDHWASPSEFLENGGDCEDFAIIKYMTLRQLGFSAEQMKIAIVYDVFSGTDHAFLTLTYNNEDFILDNRDNLTTAAHYTKRYKPHYVFNEKHLWTYDSPLIVRKVRKTKNTDVLPGNR